MALYIYIFLIREHTVQKFSARKKRRELLIWNSKRIYEITAKVFIQYKSNELPEGLRSLGPCRSDSFMSSFGIKKIKNKNSQP